MIRRAPPSGARGGGGRRQSSAGDRGVEVRKKSFFRLTPPQQPCARLSISREASAVTRSVPSSGRCAPPPLSDAPPVRPRPRAARRPARAAALRQLHGRRGIPEIRISADRIPAPPAGARERPRRLTSQPRPPPVTRSPPSHPPASAPPHPPRARPAPLAAGLRGPPWSPLPGQHARADHPARRSSATSTAWTPPGPTMATPTSSSSASTCTTTRRPAVRSPPLSAPARFSPPPCPPPPPTVPLRCQATPCRVGGAHAARAPCGRSRGRPRPPPPCPPALAGAPRGVIVAE